METDVDKNTVQAFIEWFEKNEPENFLHTLEWLVLNSHLMAYMASSPVTGSSPILVTLFKAMDRFSPGLDGDKKDWLLSMVRTRLWSGGYMDRNLEFRPSVGVFNQIGMLGIHARINRDWIGKSLTLEQAEIQMKAFLDREAFGLNGINSLKVTIGEVWWALKSIMKPNDTLHEFFKTPKKSRCDGFMGIALLRNDRVVGSVATNWDF